MRGGAGFSYTWWGCKQRERYIFICLSILCKCHNYISIQYSVLKFLIYALSFLLIMIYLQQRHNKLKFVEFINGTHCSLQSIQPRFCAIEYLLSLQMEMVRFSWSALRYKTFSDKEWYALGTMHSRISTCSLLDMLNKYLV